ncbi:DsbA family protein [Williamsia sterculiae]|uniref:Thioredoxin n=1 Tax=Williamsia sterculiae TaxID=1344003 RepID=A0A1N7FV62_9NOCA|nr:thioredoxin domain-containing protein [Williamsia sterculiae]SIS04189.1 Thioredoxin [Williamsia sterculiae]
MARDRHQPRPTSSTATYILGGLAALVIVGLVIGGVIWNNQRGKGEVDENVLAQNAALIVGDQQAPVTADVFEDFQCPYCKQLEAASGQAMVDAVKAGKLRIRFHLLTFLNSQSGSGDYSSRTAGAALCVAEGENRDVFWKFHTSLFAQQPAEHSTDLDNKRIAQIATDSGARPATSTCIVDGAKVGQANKAAQQSQIQLDKALNGQGGTPSVLVAGKPVENILDGPQWIDGLLTKASTAG